ncbi:sensor histidine kinase [Anaeromyxobacter paludicola]|uniref:histidine kinase n=1 Tax=Anaeromyxobacter paludicola TaxID=2918171 RepID=A0ABN6NCF0_9BACT|nr:ATP-binding protein [Anaeromyxobacter paludicola]BDG09993.1 hypothetical protein AMPC_31060 [Anaeromyxobacter paludicola]
MDPGGRTAPGSLAGILAARRDAILEAWAERASASLGEQLPRPALIDNMPRFLEGLERALRGEPCDAAAQASSTHGAERQQVGVSLEQILREYWLLRQVLYAELERAGGAVRLDELRILSDVVDGGVAVAVSRYVRERDAALAQRERESARAARLLELGDAFLELDRDFRILRVNANQERLSRKPRSQTVGRRFHEVWPELVDPPSRYLREYERAMRDRVPVQFEEFFAPLRMWTEVTAYPVDGAGLAVFFRDVTERKETEGRLEQARRFAQQLLGIVSHDLRNPLSAVQLGAKSLLRREDLGDAATAVVARIISAAERATRMIADLLDLTQARLGEGIAVHPRRIDLGELAEEMLRELSVAYPDRPVELRREGDLAGEWDPDRLSQVLGNLVTNAFKYGDAAAPVVITLRGEERQVCCEVRNRGPPISAELLPRLFEPLHRGPSLERAGRSIGLGLFIVREILRAHGGHIEVASGAEEGTAFSFCLPRGG